MEPVYMGMRSYPNQNGQMHYRPRCYPEMEGRPPMSYEGWPWGGNYGYAPPGACHACCNHGYMPAHCAWGSPYPHPHVPPHHWPGNYPYVPVHYMPPPPYPAMDHPRYEYEKSVPVEHHCCGCRNHPVQQKEQSNVRIEEEEPEREKRKNDSLVPSQFKNLPYPIVWLPPDYNEGGKERNTEGGKDASRDVEHGNRKTVEQQPASWNRWLPLDLSNVVSSKGRGGEEGNSPQDDGKRNFQFPFFWIPYNPHDRERENQKSKDGDMKLVLESEKGSGGDQNNHVNGENIGDRSASRVKDIPVKEAEEHVGKESSINTGKEGDTSVKIRPANDEKKMDNVEKLAQTEGSKRKSPSSPKSSKLPPVCLRVDPLPKKKSANAKSRSPSPPGDKQKPVVKSDESAKVHPSEQVKESKEKKAIPVVDGNASLEKSVTVNVETPGKPPAKSEVRVSTKQAEEKPQEEKARPQEEKARNDCEVDAADEEQSKDPVSTGGEKEESSERADAGKKCSKRELSEEEAAVVIQSAYRRFDVSRWKPLEKLRQVAKVREEIADVKRLIREMELSSDSQSRAKQKNIISETIMSLLLRLDTIQGLHPSVREVRKSVVKELVSLQEQLDTIMNEKPEDSPGEESVTRQDQGSKNEDVMMSKNTNEINPVDLQKQTEESPEANPTDEAASVKLEGDAAEGSVDEGVKSSQVPTSNKVDQKNCEVLEKIETSIDEEGSEPIVIGQGSELPSLLDNDSSARATSSTQTEDHEMLRSELAELPQGVLDDQCVAEGADHPAVEVNSSEADQSTATELPVGVLDDVRAPEDTNHPAVEADSSNGDQPQQLEEASTGPSIVDEENHQTPEAHEEAKPGLMEESKASDESKLPSTGENVPTNDEPHEDTGITDTATEEPPTETKMLGKLRAAEDTNHPAVETESSTVEESQNADGENQQTMETHEDSKPGLMEESKASDERELPTTGENITTNDEPRVNTGITEEPPTETEMSSNVEQEEPPKEGVEKQELEDAAEHDEEENHVAGEEPPKEGVEKQELEDTAKHDDGESNAVRDETKEKLIEEKERLREMVEKLIESGQEQLTAISTLSGRVKELEKRLSRKKKKLKVKQFRPPKSFDSYGEIGVAM